MSASHRRNPSVTLLSCFFFFWFFLLKILLLIPELNHRLLGYLVHLLTSASASLSSLFGMAVVHAEGVLTNPLSGQYVFIDRACTAEGVSICLLAAIWAYPARFKYKIVGSAMGILVIQSFNILRISHLFYLVQHDQSIFHRYHLYVWQPLNMGIALQSSAKAQALAGNLPEGMRSLEEAIEVMEKTDDRQQVAWMLRFRWRDLKTLWIFLWRTYQRILDDLDAREEEIDGEEGWSWRV